MSNGNTSPKHISSLQPIDERALAGVKAKADVYRAESIPRNGFDYFSPKKSLNPFFFIRKENDAYSIQDIGHKYLREIMTNV